MMYVLKLLFDYRCIVVFGAGNYVGFLGVMLTIKRDLSIYDALRNTKSVLA